jgi:hypothetical protein
MVGVATVASALALWWLATALIVGVRSGFPGSFVSAAGNSLATLAFGIMPNA